MESKIILPNDEKIVIDDKEILDFCRKEVENFIKKNKENRILFDDFKLNHRYFNPYYDFIISVLNYKHEGIIFDKNKIISADNNYFRIKDIIPSDYHSIDKPLSIPTDENLHTDYYYLDHEGYVDDMGNLLSLTNYHKHTYLGFIILLELSMMDYDICIDYLKQQNKSFSDYLVNRLGFLKTTINKTVVYNKELATFEQKEAIVDILDHNGNTVEVETNFDHEFTKKFRRTYENRRF